MRTDPFTDSLAFLIGNTPDHEALGWARFILVALYWAALIGSVAVAASVWSRDPDQQSGRNVAIWLVRVLVGTVWLRASLWALPLPVAGGFNYWVGQLAENSAWPAHARLVRDVLLPHVALLDPAVFVVATLVGLSLMLGVGVRVAGVVGILFILNLWVGLYHRPEQWSWNYVFPMVIHAFFVLDGAAACLGLGALWRRNRDARQAIYGS